MAPQKWRWDQGRLAYFQFENLKNIAKCLVDLNGVSLDGAQDPLRKGLVDTTDLPFSPAAYKVWRNYKRVFECAFLATSVDGNLFVTDFSRRLAHEDEGEMDVDEFLSLYIPRFRYPFPAFAEHSESEKLVFPFCAIIKKLLSDYLEHQSASLSPEDVFSILIGNQCTGLEPVEKYRGFPRTGHSPSGDEERQVREMLIFVSQLSILKWQDGTLQLDITYKDYEDYNGFQDLITPVVVQPQENKDADFLAITSLGAAKTYPFKLQSRETPADDIFVEGKRARVTHIKIERSPMLRRMFLKAYPDAICDMCTADMRHRYPWTDNLLEVHHLLPLSSALMVTSEGTSLTDVVGICANCHKSVHSFYKKWLNKNNLEDFRTREEARLVYQQAKENIML